MALRRLAAPVLLAVAFSTCAQQIHTLDIIFADVREDGVTVNLTIGACPRDFGEVEESVIEATDSVFVEYRAVTVRNDCGFGATIILSVPLGDRVLIDAYDDEPIPLAPFAPSSDGVEFPP